MNELQIIILATAWRPADSGLIPSISTGFSTSSFPDHSSWYVGLEWDNPFITGNSLGVGDTGYDYTEDNNTLWELFYSMPVTDNITVTPAITYLSKPFPAQDSAGMNAVSGLIKTQFKF